MTDKEFKKKCRSAKARVLGLDRVDGFADRYAGTILAAIEAGIKNPQSGALFDAYVMLEDVARAQQQIRKAGKP